MTITLDEALIYFLFSPVIYLGFLNSEDSMRVFANFIAWFLPLSIAITQFNSLLGKTGRVCLDVTGPISFVASCDSCLMALSLLLFFIDCLTLDRLVITCHLAVAILATFVVGLETAFTKRETPAK